MFILSQSKISSFKILISLIWACCPSFLIYILFLQLPFLSISRIGLSALLALIFAIIAYRNIPKLYSLPQKRLLILIIVSGLLSVIEGVALAYRPEKSYLFFSKHILRLEVLNLESGQVLKLNNFHTALEDVSYNSFQSLTGWERKGTTLSSTSLSPSPLIWNGWAGDQARLNFTGSPGVVIKVIWDGRSRIFDFGQTNGRLVIQDQFAMPLWGGACLALVLAGAFSYVLILIWINSLPGEVDALGSYIPTWVSLSSLTGFIFFIVITTLKVRFTSLELLFGISLVLLFILPVYLILRWLLAKQYWREDRFRLTGILPKYLNLLIVFFSAAMAFSVFGRSLWTKWSIIDDHEIMFFLTPGGKLSLDEFLPKLLLTEVGNFGASPRFRPSYYFLRLLETFLWGFHPMYWHLFRIIILVVGIALFWKLISPTVGWLGAGLTSAYALTFPYWSDVIGRLGPSETYAVAGLPIYVWGFIKVLQSKKMSRKEQYITVAAIFLGAIVCMGSKENFLLLVFPSLFLAVWAFKTKQPLLFFAVIGTVLFAVYIGSSVLLAVNGGGTYARSSILLAATNRGTDVYGVPISPSVRIKNVFDAFQSSQNFLPLLTLIGSLAALLAVFFKSKHSRENRKSIMLAQFWLMIFVIVILCQMYFYGGYWPTGYRYDFPGLIYIPVALCILPWLYEKLVPLNNKFDWALVLRSSFSMALITMIIMKGYSPIVQAINDNVTATNEFTQSVENIVSILRAHPDYALVIESGSAEDYEPIFSYERFLRAYGVNNGLFLRIHDYSLDTASFGLDRSLASSLLEISEMGNVDFFPLGRLPDFGGKCYSLSLSGSFNTECLPIR